MPPTFYYTFYSLKNYCCSNVMFIHAHTNSHSGREGALVKRKTVSNLCIKADAFPRDKHSSNRVKLPRKGSREGASVEEDTSHDPLYTCSSTSRTTTMQARLCGAWYGTHQLWKMSEWLCSSNGTIHIPG